MLQWKCKSGQGELGKSVQDIKPISQEICGDKCLLFDGCVGFDYSTVISSCRLYKKNTPRAGAVGHSRKYCKIQYGGEKEFVQYNKQFI